jgi:hypothetical protein
MPQVRPPSDAPPMRELQEHGIGQKLLHAAQQLLAGTAHDAWRFVHFVTSLKACLLLLNFTPAASR